VRDGDELGDRRAQVVLERSGRRRFAIVFAVTDPDAEPHRRGTMLLVPAETPGVEIVRPVPVLGHAGRGWNTHCEVRFTGVRGPGAEHARREGDAVPPRPEAASARVGSTT
jgi:alkylation response protein AidB-like acyl-CoA dehydrogenase